MRKDKEKDANDKNSSSKIELQQKKDFIKDVSFTNPGLEGNLR